MRYLQARSFCAALCALFAIAESLSIHGAKNNHAHLHRHGGKGLLDSPAMTLVARDTTPSSLSIELVNNYDSENIHAYIQTTSADSSQSVLITADGTVYQPVANSKYVATTIPQDANCGIPLGARGSSVTITMPIHMITGRIYIADGELTIGVLQGDSGTSLQNPTFQNRGDSNFNTSFGFVEANQPEDCLWVNPSYVDFVGMPLGVQLVTEKDTAGVTGLPNDGIAKVCEQLVDEQKRDGYPWSDLCLRDDDGNPIRIVSPTHNPQGFSDYFDDYIEQVWQYIASNSIQFDNQDGTPLVSCHIEGDSMICDRTSRPFPKPTSTDIWGCNSGPFAQTGDQCYRLIGARFCAAFHRATFLLPGGAVQPGQDLSLYYPADTPHDKYSRIVHQVQTDHHGYTFAYDDVKPNMTSPGAEVSGTIASDGVRVLRIVVGGLSSDNGQEDASVPASDTSSTSQSSTTVHSSSSTEAEITQEASDVSSTAQSTISVSQSSTTEQRSTQGKGRSKTLDQPIAATTQKALDTSTNVQTSTTRTSSSEPSPGLTSSQSPITPSSTSSMTTSIAQEAASSTPGDSTTAQSAPDGVEIITIVETAVVTQVVTQTSFTTEFLR